MHCIEYYKMQATQNYFGLVDWRSVAGRVQRTLSPASAKILAKHARADQVLVLRKDARSSVDCFVEIWNADGSTSAMCGNGLRAVALYLAQENKKDGYLIATHGGVFGARMIEVCGSSARVEVEMGIPVLSHRSHEAITVLGKKVEFFEVLFANPHAVVFCDDLSKERTCELGPEIETHPRFPERTNVEFVKVREDKSLDVMVWERGTGFTLACGSGASASAVVAISHCIAVSPLTVHMPGGDLVVRWDASVQGAMVRLEGDVELTGLARMPADSCTT